MLLCCYYKIKLISKFFKYFNSINIYTISKYKKKRIIKWNGTWELWIYIKTYLQKIQSISYYLEFLFWAVFPAELIYSVDGKSLYFLITETQKHVLIQDEIFCQINDLKGFKFYSSIKQYPWNHFAFMLDKKKRILGKLFFNYNQMADVLVFFWFHAIVKYSRTPRENFFFFFVFKVSKKFFWNNLLTKKCIRTNKGRKYANCTLTQNCLYN